MSTLAFVLSNTFKERLDLLQVSGFSFTNLRLNTESPDGERPEAIVRIKLGGLKCMLV